MHRKLIISAAVAAVLPSLSFAQDAAPGSDLEAFQIAVNSGVCGEAGVASASFNAEGNVEANCNEDGFILPLGAGGAMLPAVALGGILVALAAGGGGGTNGTN